MRFNYTAVPVDRFHTGQPDAVAYRPIVNITLENSGNEISTKALVDSGADYCVFPADFGLAIKLNVFSVQPEFLTGINNIPIEVYFHDITLILGINRLPARCGFIKGLTIGLLGQEGFFNHYNLIFFYEQKYFDIVPRHKNITTT